MSGLEVAAAVFGLVAGTIDIIHKSVEIYGAVKDKSGIPTALRKVSDKLPSIEKLLKDARAQYDEGQLDQIDKQTWESAKQEIEQCKRLCQELHQLLLSAYPDAGSGRVERVWKGTQTVFSSKGKSAEALLKEIWEHLDILATQQIINNTALLKEIRTLVEELCPQATATYMYNEHGDNIGELYGDKVTGDKFGGDKVAGNKDSHIHHHTHSASVTVDEIIDRLPCAKGALYNSKAAREARPLEECLQGTRIRVLDQIRSWLQAENEPSIFWLDGIAGAGKSTIANTVAKELATKKQLGATFFFTRGGGDAASTGKFCTTIARQLALKQRSTTEWIARAIKENPDFDHELLRDQWTTLILNPLKESGKHVTRSLIVFVIDALDECSSEKDVGLIVDLLQELGSIDTVKVRVLLTGRPTLAIRAKFKKTAPLSRVLCLHKEPRVEVDADVSLFLRAEFEKIRDAQEWLADWPTEQEFESLIRLIDGLFIVAATICRFLDPITNESRESEDDAQSMLSKFLSPKSKSIAGDKIDSAESFGYEFLDHTYATVMENYVKKGSKTLGPRMLMLGEILALKESLSISMLAELLSVGEGQIRTRLNSLASVIRLPTEDGGLVVPYHTSFRDFVLDDHRSGSWFFHIKHAKIQASLGDKCLNLLESSSGLKEDICEVKHPGTVQQDLSEDLIQKRIRPQLAYACCNWALHLQESDRQSRCDDSYMNQCNHREHRFLEKHFLHWLEAVGWLRRPTSAIHNLEAIQSGIDPNLETQLHGFVKDAILFVRKNVYIVKHAPLQTYYSALSFTPLKSIIRKTFGDGILTCLEANVVIPELWNADTRYLLGHEAPVSAVAFSSNGKIMASGAEDGTIGLWNVDQGVLMHEVQGPSVLVTSLCFSHGDSKLASVWSDNTVRVTHLESRETTQELDKTKFHLRHVMFSNDDILVAFGLQYRGEKTVAVSMWSRSSGITHYEIEVLEGSRCVIQNFKMSPDGSLIAIASKDGVSGGDLEIYHSSTRGLIHSFRVHSDWVTALDFSEDGSMIALGYYDGLVQLWSIQAPKMVTCWAAAAGRPRVGRLAISRDCSQIASFYSTGELQMLQTRSSTRITSHALFAEDVSFSPSSSVLAIASKDAIRLWDTSLAGSNQQLDYRNRDIKLVRLSADGTVALSHQYNGRSSLWETSTGTKIYDLERIHCFVDAWLSKDASMMLVYLNSGIRSIGLWKRTDGPRISIHPFPPYSRTISMISSCHFSDDCRTVVLSHGESLLVLEVPSLRLIQKVMRFESWAREVRYSPDRSSMAWSSTDGTLELQEATKETSDWISGPRHRFSAKAVAFSPDGSVVATGSTTGLIRLWNLTSMAVAFCLIGHEDRITALTTASDGNMWASASVDRTVRVWRLSEDPSSKELSAGCMRVYQHNSTPSAIAISPDAQILASGSDDNTIILIDPSTEQPETRLEGHSGQVTSLSFSPDGLMLASASADKTVWLWKRSTGHYGPIFTGHKGRITAVVLYQDIIHGLVGASASWDRTIRLWQVSTSKEIRCIPIDHWTERLEISKDAKVLHADTQDFYVGQDAFWVNVEEVPQVGLQLKEQWICYGNEKLLWLPPESRGVCNAQSDDDLVLGHETGDMSFYHYRKPK